MEKETGRSTNIRRPGFNSQVYPGRNGSENYIPSQSKLSSGSLNVAALTLDTLSSKFVALQDSLRRQHKNPSQNYNQQYETLKRLVAEQEKTVMSFTPAEHQLHLNNLITELNNTRELRPYNGVEITLLERRVRSQQQRVTTLTNHNGTRK